MNGLAVIEKTDTETKGFFIDQDALECARQNAKVSKRLDEAAKAKQKAFAEAEKAKHEADRKRRKAEKAEARRKVYTVRTAGFVLSRMAICAAITWAGTAGMIHPFIYIPVALFCLCAACLRLGTLFGRAAK